MNLQSLLKRIPYLYPAVSLSRTYGSKGAIGTIPYAKLIFRFIEDYQRYIRANSNPKFEVGENLFYPCIFDRTRVTPIEPTYFFQDSWAAGKISKMIPTSHVDIGSSVMTMAVISQFVKTTFVDIRPIELELDGLDYKQGTILNLPFDDESVQSLSSLCVIEHIGLGRYGDPIDSFGSEKAVTELKRILAKGGNLYVSLPVDIVNRVYFNAHRAFTRDYVLELFAGLKLADEKYHYGSRLYEHYDPAKGFGTGLFQFTK